MRGAAMLTWLMRVVAASLLVVAAAACGASPDHYVSVLDELPVPSDWQLVYLTISAPGGPDVSSDPGTPR